MNGKTKLRWKIVPSFIFCFYPTSQPLADTQCKPVNESETQDVHKLEPGESFRDCANCPEMVVIQAGSFEMGDLTGDGLSREKPVHHVTIAKHFAIGKYEITFQQWDACHEAGGCSFRPDDLNWGRENRAVGDVSWSDAREYVDWLSCLTGADYRLPSESEWEYMARAGSMTRYPWGDDLGKAKARCLTCGAGLPQTLTVGSFAPNDFGVYDTVGSVGEWVEDCLNNSYTGAPSDGSAWVSGQCSYRIVRGGGWYGDAKFQTSSYRNYKNTGARDDTFGIRVARSHHCTPIENSP